MARNSNLRPKAQRPDGDESAHADFTEDMIVTPFSPTRIYGYILKPPTSRLGFIKRICDRTLIAKNQLVMAAYLTGKIYSNLFTHF